MHSARRTQFEICVKTAAVVAAFFMATSSEASVGISISGVGRDRDSSLSDGEDRTNRGSVLAGVEHNESTAGITREPVVVTGDVGRQHLMGVTVDDVISTNISVLVDSRITAQTATATAPINDSVIESLPANSTATVEPTMRPRMALFAVKDNATETFTTAAPGNVSRNATEFQCYSCEGAACNQPPGNVTRCSPSIRDFTGACLMTYNVKKSLRTVSCATVFPGRTNCSRHLGRYSDAGNLCEYCCMTPLCNLDKPESELSADCRTHMHSLSSASMLWSQNVATWYLAFIGTVVAKQLPMLLATAVSSGESF